MDKQELDDKISEVSRTILSYCITRTSNQHEAEDLAQDIIIEIMKAIKNLRDEKAFYGFMWSVANNIYKQWCKKKQLKSECELSDDIPDERDTFDSILDDNSDIYRLRNSLSLLSQKYRRATILYYLEEKSCSEISSILDITESMVKYLLFKSRKLLKEGMSMEKSYGEQSYRPKSLSLLYMGEGPNHYWNLVEGSRVRQNILWACYNDRLTEDEVALQIGVSLPYIEDDLKALTEAGLLSRDGTRYRTNIIIISEEFNTEVSSKLRDLQTKTASNMKAFIDSNIDAVRSIGFYGSDMSQNTLRWQLTCIILRYAYSHIADELFAPGKFPLTTYGEHAYVWGAERIIRGFNICSMDANESNTDISMYLLDWLENPQSSGNDFYSNHKFIIIYAKLAHGQQVDSNIFEQEIVSELIKKRYVYKKNGGLRVTMPIFTKKELDSLLDILRPEIDQTAELFIKINKTIAGVLQNHVPVHLKAQVDGIAGMILFNNAVYVPASILNKEGYLSTDWDVNENATSYVVLV